MARRQASCSEPAKRVQQRNRGIPSFRNDASDWKSRRASNHGRPEMSVSGDGTREMHSSTGRAEIYTISGRGRTIEYDHGISTYFDSGRPGGPILKHNNNNGATSSKIDTSDSRGATSSKIDTSDSRGAIVVK